MTEDHAEKIIDLLEQIASLLGDLNGKVLLPERIEELIDGAAKKITDAVYVAAQS